MTSTVVITADPESTMNVVRVVHAQQSGNDWTSTETIIQTGASATFLIGPDDSISIREDFVVVIPSPEKDTP